MKIKVYAERGGMLALSYGNEAAHHWHVDVTADEYTEIVERFKSIDWVKKVRWYPKYVPSKVLTGTTLQMHIIAEDDRDATLVRLSL